MDTKASPTPRSHARNGASRSVFYAAVGSELRQYDVNIETAELLQRGSSRLPAAGMYAWQHKSRKYLYVVSSNRGADPSEEAILKEDLHHLTAFKVDPTTGALTPHGAPVPLPSRPIHITTDEASEYVITAYRVGGLTVHRIAADGSIAGEVKQAAGLDAGHLPHQVRMMSASTVIVPARGYDATDKVAEIPGAIKTFKFRDGILTPDATVAPNGGFGFGPRHLDFHPTKPWLYVSLERQHKIALFMLDGDKVGSAPVCTVDTLAEPDNRRYYQMASTIHVHPKGHVVYGAERGSGVKQTTDGETWVGGENALLVYAIDQSTGRPSLIQRMELNGMHPRTYDFDLSGRLMIATCKSPVLVKDGRNVRMVPACLDVFRIADDGRLTRERTVAVDVRAASMFWSGWVFL